MTVISETGLLVTTWVFFAFAFVLTGFRLYVRHYKSRGLGWDDLLHVAAVLLLVALNGINTNINHLIFRISQVTTGEAPITASFLYYEVPKYINCQFATQILFSNVVWLVKGSFLLFYRGFFTGLRHHLIAWWIVTVFTVLAYISIYPPFMFACGSVADYFSINACLTPTSIKKTRVNIIYIYAADMSSDLMIMALPMRILWNLRVTLRQKLGLATAFSLAFIIIIMSTVRLVVTLSTLTPNGTTSLERADPVGLTLWSMLEVSVAVIVSCLPSFRVLFLNPQRRRDQERKKHSSRSYGKPVVSDDNDGAASNWTRRWFRLPGVTSVGGENMAGDEGRRRGFRGQDTQKTLVGTELTTMSRESLGPKDMQIPEPIFAPPHFPRRSWMTRDYARAPSPVDEEAHVDRIAPVRE